MHGYKLGSWKWKLTIIFYSWIKTFFLSFQCWADSGTSSAKGYLTLPRQEPVRPIDPGAWVAHTAAVRGNFKNSTGCCYENNINLFSLLYPWEGYFIKLSFFSMLLFHRDTKHKVFM